MKIVHNLGSAMENRRELALFLIDFGVLRQRLFNSSKRHIKYEIFIWVWYSLVECFTTRLLFSLSKFC